MLGHFIFVMLIVLIISSVSYVRYGIIPFLLGFAFSLLSMFVSHGISFYTNYLGKKEYENKTLIEVMYSPYPRVIVMHLSIMALGFLGLPLAWLFGVIALLDLVYAPLGYPVGWILTALIITAVVATKTVIDLAYHAGERKRFGSL